MSLSRRSLLVAAGAAAPLLLARPALAAPPDLSTPEGWLSWISAHRAGLSLRLDDGRGGRLSHRADIARPLASAVKVLHLAAYADAVAAGRLDPREQVRVGDWERYYVPTDGGAHPAALRHLGVPLAEAGLHAADPEQRVALDDVVAVMILFSDSAAPDLLRDRLGAEAVIAAGAARGWPEADVRSLCAEYLFVVLPETAPPAGLPVPARREWGFALERRHRDEPALRQEVLRRLQAGVPGYPAQLAWASTTAAGSADRLAAAHRALSAEGGIARTHLERPLAGSLPPGVSGIGIKGGSLPGVLTSGISVRRADGTLGWGALLAHGDISAEQLSTGDPGLPLLLAIEDPGWRDRLATALGG
ncbi:serine hydrolase [Saccharopolyspora sp. TS4A08]|uniref:Beta-lactamase n=1 Tax=Saccharopolyspora ipomoeae TaxID=3042027 RepID=A0ABT6PTU7_9PSEU|nr:serine hydrolase [Saccharopolyspora sp. TS4A08]MDI2031058.1 serine hydrolase [Saccharopolyspora sp. TS4A08]